MPLLNTYAIWNNKGGVGKSTITFHLASRYAQQNPNTKVLVIDLCPQSNASMMLLGGGQTGEQHVMTLCTQPLPSTVVGYLSTVISQGAGAPLPNPYNFLTDVGQTNHFMPNNLYLMCGDGNLEPMSPAITGAAAAPALNPQLQPWVWVHSIFRNLIQNLALGAERWMVFIDTNPSFSIYTELAISAADRLITPVNADDSSRVAANAMFILLHGQTPPHPVYGAWTFATRSQTFGMAVPQIHVIVGNRLTQYGGAARAFSSLSDATANTLYSAFTAHPSFFSTPTQPINSVGDFRNNYSVALRDFNTAGVVAAHLGRPLSSMTQGYYPVNGIDVKVNTDKVTECEAALDDVLTHVT